VPIENEQLFEWSIRVKLDKKYPDLCLYGYLMGKKYPGMKPVGLFLMEKIRRSLSWNEGGVE